MPLKASIIVPFHGRWKLTQRCLRALRKHTAGSFEILAVDNASPAADARNLRLWAKSWDKLRVIRNRKNLPFAEAINAAMRQARGEALIWLNNDAVVGPGWLDELLAPLAQGFAASGPMTDHMAPPIQIGELGEGVLEADFLGGFCFALNRKALESIGYLDERFIWGWEDIDYCLRLRQAGLRLALVRSVFVRHDGSRTLSKMPPKERRDGDLANRRLVLDKWPESGKLGRDLRELFRSTRARWHSFLPEATIILMPGAQKEHQKTLRRLAVDSSRKRFEVLSIQGGDGRALNRTLREAAGDYFIFLRPGATLGRDWFAQLLDAAKKKRGLGALTAVRPGGGFKTAPIWLDPFCLLIPRTCSDVCGAFDESLTADAALLDYSFRLRRAGRNVGSCGVEVDAPISTLTSAQRLRLLKYWLPIPKIGPSLGQELARPKNTPPANPRFSMIFPAEHCGSALESDLTALRTAAAPGSYELLILLDHPSVQDRQRFSRLARTWPELRFLPRGENPGTAGAINDGLRASRGENIVLLSNVLTPSKGWLEALANARKRLANCGAVAPIARGEIFQGRILALPKHAGPEELAQAGQAARAWAGSEALTASSLPTHCLLFPRRVAEHVGNLDENLSRHDALVDYLLRVLRAGFQIARAPKAVIIPGKPSPSSPASRSRLLKKWAVRDDLALWESVGRRKADALA